MKRLLFGIGNEERKLKEFNTHMGHQKEKQGKAAWWKKYCQELQKRKLWRTMIIDVLEGNVDKQKTEEVVKYSYQ